MSFSLKLAGTGLGCGLLAPAGTPCCARFRPHAVIVPPAGPIAIAAAGHILAVREFNTGNWVRLHALSVTVGWREVLEYDRPDSDCSRELQV
jgi:hypothetical protein